MAKYKGDVQAYKVGSRLCRLRHETLLNSCIAELDRQQPQAKALNVRVAQTVNTYFALSKSGQLTPLQITVSHLHISTEDSSAGLPAPTRSYACPEPSWASAVNLTILK